MYDLHNLIFYINLSGHPFRTIPMEKISSLSGDIEIPNGDNQQIYGLPRLV